MAKTMPPVLKTPRWAEVNCHRRSSVVGKLSVFECLSAWRDKAWHQTYPLSTLAPNSNAAENRQVGFHIYHIWQKMAHCPIFSLISRNSAQQAAWSCQRLVTSRHLTWGILRRLTLHESTDESMWDCPRWHQHFSATYYETPPGDVTWRQQETRLGRMLIKNYRTKYAMNGRKRVEFCRKTALPATSMQQFNQAGGFRHNLGSYDHLRSECPMFQGAEFVSWQFSI